MASMGRFNSLLIGQSCSKWGVGSVIARAASSKIRKPVPRSYNRRLIDEFTAPVVPTERQPRSLTCTRRTELTDVYVEQQQQLSEVEASYAAYVHPQLFTPGILAVVQVFMGVSNYHKTLDTHAMLAEGLHYKNHGNKIMRHLVKDTKLASLTPLFSGHTGIIIAKHRDSLKALMAFNRKVHWLKILGGVLDGTRVLSAQELEALARRDATLDVALPGETLALLQAPAVALTQTLDAPALRLVTLLDAYAKREETPAGEGKE